MPLPEMTARGELPPGVHHASLDEVAERFGGESAERRRCTATLRKIYDLATTTGQLDRLVLFGSYLTDKPSPNDVDLILIMTPGFEPEDAPEGCRILFDPARAQAEVGASVFWITEVNIIGMTPSEFIWGWQLTRENTLRGIVEIAR